MRTQNCIVVHVLMCCNIVKCIFTCSNDGPSFAFLNLIVTKCSDVSEKHGAFIFRMTESVQVDTERMQQMEVCLLYRMVLGSSASHSYGRWKEGDGAVTNQWEFQNPKAALLRASSSGDMKVRWTQAIDIVCSCGSCCLRRGGLFSLLENTQGCGVGVGVRRNFRWSFSL
jgi:hypothetical protein